MNTGTVPGKPAGLWRRAGLAAAAALLTVAMLVTTGATTSLPLAQANDYPSWAEVEAARRNAANTQAAITRINAAIEALNKELEPLREIANQKGEIYVQALEKADQAQWEADQLDLKAKSAEETAALSTRQAGILASQLNNGGTGDMGLSLFLKGDTASDLLYQLGMMNQLSSQTSQIFEQATADRNTARSLLDQAELAYEALEEIALEAEEAYQEAVTAQQAVQTKLEEQEGVRSDLARKLILLRDNVRLTEEQYIEGILANIGASGYNPDAGPISEHGWVRPVKGGWHSSAYGMRIHPIDGTWRMHGGTDIALGCGNPVYAASAGRVVFSGWGGSTGFGNFVRIDHGNGVETWYAHMQNNSLTVSYGQIVNIGQQIGRIGTTGASTGCHLHLEYRINGNHADPIANFRAKGVVIF